MMHPICLPLAALLILSACTARSSSEDAPEAGPRVVTLTATDAGYEAPDTVSAGWAIFRLVNEGTRPHAAQLVRLEEGRTLDEFVEAYEHAWRTVGPRPAWGRRIGGPGLAGPGESSNATLYLEPGSYAWVCPMWEDGTPHVFADGGMAHSFVVEAAAADALGAAPEATAEIELFDYTFRVSAPLAAGRHVFHVVNHGAEPHEVALGRLAPGQSIEDVLAWLENPEGPKPEGEGLGGVNALANGAEAFFEADLAPGDYVLLCFVTAPDGRPHVAHGMVQPFHVD